MKTTKQLLGAVSAFALVAMTSAPVLAQGTTAGSIIRNEVSVSYNVGNITQNAEIASDEFTVDQRVNVTVGFIGSATVVNPGQEGAAIAFDVTNLSNSIVDLDLDAALRNGTDANIGDFLIYRDTNGDRVLDATEEATRLADGTRKEIAALARKQARAQTVSMVSAGVAVFAVVVGGLVFLRSVNDLRDTAATQAAAIRSPPPGCGRGSPRTPRRSHRRGCWRPSSARSRSRWGHRDHSR